MTTQRTADTQPQPTSARDEIKAMGRIAAILDTVDETCSDRIAVWVFERYRQPETEVR
jgi:hypothetical protein